MSESLSRRELEVQNEQLRQELAVRTVQTQALESRAGELESQTQRMQARIAELESIYQEQQRLIATYQRYLFGSRSEKIDAQELEARIAEHAREAGEQMAQQKRPGDPPPQAEEERPEPRSDNRSQRKARPHGRNPLPAHLPRKRIEHPVEPSQCVCPQCVEHPPLIKIGEDIREKLHKLPVQYEVHEHVYPKFACARCDFGIRMAEGPEQSLKADESVIADVVVQKYADHKPLYRQEQAFARVGILLRRQTLCDWTGWCSQQVEPVVRAMADHICAQKLIQSDETSVRMQLADGQMQKGRLWAYGLPWQEVVFDFRTDKSQTGPKEFLRGAQAKYLQADAGSSYEPVLKELELNHVGCMAHIRRKIFEAREDAPVAADLVLATLQKLYRLEAKAKENMMEPDALLELRQGQAKPIFTDLGGFLQELSKNVLPKSPLGKAIRYAQNQWPAMARYLEVPQAQLDNNSIEHALRDVVMGRKNWLHVGQEAGGEKAANLFSLMVSCKRLGVEPYAYLHDILQRLARHLNKDIWQLTPRGWKETFAPRPSAQAPSR